MMVLVFEGLVLMFVLVLVCEVFMLFVLLVWLVLFVFLVLFVSFVLLVIFVLLEYKFTHARTGALFSSKMALTLEREHSFKD